MTPPLIVVGAGGHGRVVADTAAAAGHELVAFADDRLLGTRVLGLQVVSAAPSELAAFAARRGAALVIGVGGNRARQGLQLELRALGVELASVIHPTAVVSSHALIGAGCMLLAQCQVAVGARLGEGVIVNHGASIDHDAQIGPFSHLSPGVHTGGEVEIGEGVHLAVGVSVRNRVRIGAWSVVGVGAAVVGDLPGGAVAMGVPARVKVKEPPAQERG